MTCGVRQQCESARAEATRGKLGSRLGKYMTDHENYVNVLGKGKSNVVIIHLPREVRQFDSTEQALEEGFIPFSGPRGWSIGRNKWRQIDLDRGNIVGGYEADLILDSVDVPRNVEGYVANVTSWSDDSVNPHFNISAQFYKRKEEKIFSVIDTIPGC